MNTVAPGMAPGQRSPGIALMAPPGATGYAGLAVGAASVGGPRASPGGLSPGYEYLREEDGAEIVAMRRRSPG